ncbi:DNA topoisomerase III [Macrococcus hajekii]|uniref:DNA topoisomerase 3 n=1 Tax=Macrococcus hajekii TaxID=198482 RepID=A0A4R6BJG8_9STAP|nr:DNA topoisomerase III [Macrococcus hajekii]TDM01849.1 DNA topoisomerase III [Macrococcus hajekii]GGB07965.1 DNA topoisomerase 3 [Macrococcus hajekii]
MKSVVLAEKPSVARDIARVLGCNQKKEGYMENNRYIVTWALGHLVTNADPEQYDVKYKTWGLNELPILPKYMKTVVISKTRKQFNTVKNQIERSDVSEVIIATDAGREGELVARLILEKCKGDKPVKRLWISSVTDKAIKDGFNKLKDGRQYQGLYDAALARSEADWIVGINATRALTTKYDAQLSTGRVQTPTLQMVKMRQDEINQFKARQYYGLEAVINGTRFNGPNQIFDEAQVDNMLKDLSGQTATVISVERQEKKKYPDQLYDLTSLQQEAYKRYQYSAKETLSTMQNLYESHKLVTYPRTDANYLTEDMIPTLRDRVASLSATQYRPVVVDLIKTPIKGSKHFIDDTKVSDHHAIVPTEVKARLDDLTLRERHIYELIAERFLSVLLKPYRYELQTVKVKIGQTEFTAKHERPLELGFKALYEQLTEKTAPAFNKGDVLSAKLSKTQGETTPPPYFNEGTLLKAMENPAAIFKLDKESRSTLKETGGIGTVATRADIIEKLYNLNAIESHGGKLRVTNKGKQLLELAPEELKSPALTADWEHKLTLIERGKYQRKAFINEMRAFTEKLIQGIKDSEDKFKHDNLTSTECPACGKFMLEIKTKNAKMLVCQDPTCKTKKNVQRKTNARCPNCKKKLTLHGKGPKAMYSCVCGFHETQEQMDKRFSSKKTGKVSRQELKKYTQKEEPINNPFADALKGLKL